MPLPLANTCLWRGTFLPSLYMVLATIKTVYVSFSITLCSRRSSLPSGLRLCLQVWSSHLSRLTLGFPALYLTVIFTLCPTFSFKTPVTPGISSCVQPIRDLVRFSCHNLMRWINRVSTSSRNPGETCTKDFPAIIFYCFSRQLDHFSVFRLDSMKVSLFQRFWMHMGAMVFSFWRQVSKFVRYLP